MHWLVEVSRVGDTVASERYCIEARRWQSALQEARRLRGDNGALPRLTIELTDSGYRAVDPELKVRYVVSEAPPGTPLTDGARTAWSTKPPPVDSEPPAAAPNPIPTLASPPSPVATQAAAVVVSSVTNVSSVARPPSVPPAAVSVAPPQVIRQREELPTPASPIAYRELALAVKAGTPRTEVDALLRARLEELSAPMPKDARRFVQIAVFDHVFVKRPVRPPLGVLSWKDWRGEPSLSFPGFGDFDELPPPSSLSTARAPSWSAAMTSLPPRPEAPPPPGAAPSVVVPMAPVVPVVPMALLVPVVPVAVPAEPASVPPAASAEPRSGSLVPSRVVSIGPSAAPPAESVPPVAVPSAPPAAAVANEAVTAPSVAAPEPAAPVELAPQSAPVSAHRSEPSRLRSDPPHRRSDPGVAPPRRRAPGEDLISELFDRMGELTFMGDIPSGADYVLNALFDVIPCEAMLVHVFDLGRREFVVVRAHGPRMRDALLFRTPDSDPAVAEVMRQRSVVSNGAAPVHSGAFDRLGVQAKQILSGAARQGGRYLGIIELANPSGGAPFSDSEKHALEYVCEQFAEFIAGRPLVLDAELVMRS